MRLTNLMRLIIRRNGQPEWVEVRDPYLPRGYKIFDYSPKYYGSILLISGYITYIMAQSELNPDSYHGKIMKIFNTVTGSVSDTVRDATGIGEKPENSEQAPAKK